MSFSAADNMDEGNDQDTMYLPDVHLDSPLIPETVEQARAAYYHAQSPFTQVTQPEVPFHSWVGNTFLHHGWFPVGDSSWTEKSASSLHPVLKTLDQLNTTNFASRPMMKLSPQVCALSALRDSLDEFVEKTALSIAKRDQTPVIVRAGELYLQSTRAGCLFVSPTHFSIGSYNCLTMFADCVNQRFMTLAACEVATHYQSPGYPSSDLLLKLFVWGDKLLAKSGNEAYDVIKMLEAMCTVSVHEQNPSYEIGNPGDFAKSMITECGTLCDRLGSPESLSELRSILSSLSVPEALQVFGLFRLWGHPIVFVGQGIEANRKVAQASKVLNPGAVDRLSASFKKMIINGYREKFHKYPSLSFGSLPSTHPLCTCYAKNLAVPVNVSVEDWDQVSASLSFDDVDDIDVNNIIKDKACGFPLPRLLETIRGKNKGLMEERRVIMQYMMYDVPSARDLLARFDQHGLEPDDLTIGVTPKERELKRKPRLFSLLTMSLKMYFGLTEALIAEHILPLIPECTMGSDFYSIMDAQYQATELMKGTGDFAVVVLNMDFEKWNLNMRNLPTRKCFQFLDELFGKKHLIARTHDILKSCWFYCSDGYHFPDVVDGKLVEGEYAWTNQEGGVEGLRQKGWTLWTLAGIKAGLEGESVDTKLQGQGDNQVVRFAFPVLSRNSDGEIPESELSRLRAEYSRIQRKVAEFFHEVGMPLKLEESWSSSFLFTYGKVPTTAGAPQPMSLKKLSRSFRTANAEIPSIVSSLMNIFANGQAACSMDYSLLVPYVATYHEAWRCVESFLTRHPATGEAALHTSTRRWKRKYEPTYGKLTGLNAPVASITAALMRGHLSVGGLPIQTPLEFLSRGFPDPLSQYFTWVDLLIPNLESEEEVKLMKCWSRPILDHNTPDLSSLLKNPTGCWILTPPKKEVTLKLLAKKAMAQSSKVQNSTIRQYLKLTNDDEPQFVSATVLSSPLFPRFVAEVYDASVFGYVDRFLGKFDSTKTIRGMARGMGFSLSRPSLNTEIDAICIAIKQSQACGPELPGCATRRAQALRCVSWKREDIRGVTVPHPLHTFSPSLTKDVVVVQVSNMVEEDSGAIWSKRGPARPYFGSLTQELKGYSTEYVLQKAEPVTRKIKKLLSTVGWVVAPGSPWAKFLEHLYSSMTNAPILSSNILSTAAHHPHSWVTRYKDAYTSHGGSMSILYTGLTHVWSINSGLDQWKNEIGDTKSVHFQSMMLCQQHLKVLGCIYDRENMTTESHWKFSCSECLCENEGEMLTGASALEEVQFLKHEGVTGLWHTYKGRVPRPRPGLPDVFTVKDATLPEHGFMLLGWYLASSVLYPWKAITVDVSNINTSWVHVDELLQCFLRWACVMKVSDALPTLDYYDDLGVLEVLTRVKGDVCTAPESSYRTWVQLLSSGRLLYQLERASGAALEMVNWSPMEITRVLRLAIARSSVKAGTLLAAPSSCAVLDVVRWGVVEQGLWHPAPSHWMRALVPLFRGLRIQDQTISPWSVPDIAELVHRESGEWLNLYRLPLVVLSADLETWCNTLPPAASAAPLGESLDQALLSSGTNSARLTWGKARSPIVIPALWLPRGPPAPEKFEREDEAFYLSLLRGDIHNRGVVALTDSLSLIRSCALLGSRIVTGVDLGSKPECHDPVVVGGIGLARADPSLVDVVPVRGAFSPKTIDTLISSMKKSLHRVGVYAELDPTKSPVEWISIMLVIAELVGAGDIITVIIPAQVADMCQLCAAVLGSCCPHVDRIESGFMRQGRRVMVLRGYVGDQRWSCTVVGGFLTCSRQPVIPVVDTPPPPEVYKLLLEGGRHDRALSSNQLLDVLIPGLEPLRWNMLYQDLSRRFLERFDYPGHGIFQARKRYRRFLGVANEQELSTSVWVLLAARFLDNAEKESSPIFICVSVQADGPKLHIGYSQLANSLWVFPLSSDWSFDRRFHTWSLRLLEMKEDYDDNNMVTSEIEIED